MSLRSPPRFSRARPASRSKKRGGESSPAHWEEWAGLLRLMEALLFVGERRSQAAVRMGVRWQDGRLAAKQLFDALRAAGVDLKRCKFVNWWERGSRQQVVEHVRRGGLVVAMGRKVERALKHKGVAHLSIIHPAARGAIRKKERYSEHIRYVFGEGKAGV